MLVLSRKQQESIVINANVTITVLRVKGNKVQIGIDAPHDVHVVRGELSRLGFDDRPGDAASTTERKTGVQAGTKERGARSRRPLRHFLRGARPAEAAAPTPPIHVVGRAVLAAEAAVGHL